MVSNLKKSGLEQTVPVLNHFFGTGTIYFVRVKKCGFVLSCRHFAGSEDTYFSGSVSEHLFLLAAAFFPNYPLKYVVG